MRKMEEVDVFIRDYFNGNLSEREAKQFQEKYDHDPEFRKEADLIEVEVLGLRSHGRESLKKTFAQWEDEAASAKESKSFPFFRMAIAASVLVALVFIGKWALKSNPAELFVAYYEPYENFEYTATRDQTSELDSNQALAYAKYDAAKYEEAAYYFNQYLIDTPEDLSAIFFKAICHLELGHDDLAIADFIRIEKRGLPYYSEASLWYISLVEMRMGQLESAKSHLGQLKLSKDYGTKANELLDQLN